MKKILIVFVFLLIPALGFGQTRFVQSVANTIDVPFTFVSTNQATTSGTVTNFTFFLTKASATSSTAMTMIPATASGGTNDLVYRGTLGNFELTAGNLDTLGNTKLCWTYVGGTIAFDCAYFEVVSQAAMDLTRTTGPATLASFWDYLVASCTTPNSICAYLVENADSPTSLVPAAVLNNIDLNTYKKNVAYDNMQLFMQTNLGVPVTGATLTCTLQQEDNAPTPVSGGITEEGGGHYTVDLTQAEMNFNNIAVDCTSTGGSGTSLPFHYLIQTQR